MTEVKIRLSALRQALELLKPGGRLCVITFHSLEDRICKSIFKEYSTLDDNLKKMPIVPLELLPKYKVVANIKPTKQELKENPRARSAKLRVIEKIER